MKLYALTKFALKWDDTITGPSTRCDLVNDGYGSPLCYFICYKFKKDCPEQFREFLTEVKADVGRQKPRG